jgi:protein-S-isoprenylcysteine O-methyltransferase Ste14
MQADTARVFVPPPLIFAGPLVVGLLIDGQRIHFGVLEALGVAIAAAGLSVIVSALVLFRKSRTHPEPWRPASAFVTDGLYRVTRNPMYLGMTLLCLGIAVAFHSVAGIVASLLSALIVDRLVIAREETYLLRTFGDEYAAYKRQVRRWL